MNSRLQTIGKMFKEFDKNIFCLEIQKPSIFGSDDYIYVSIRSLVGFDITESDIGDKTDEEVYQKFLPKLKKLVDDHYLREL